MNNDFLLRDEIETSCNELKDYGVAISDLAKWYNLGDDYCDSADVLKSIENYALEMVDHLNNVFNCIEEIKKECE